MENNIMPHLPYIWDSWYRYDAVNQLFHVYYLNVDDHALVGSEQHHFSSKLGYATTKDFVTFEYVNHTVLTATPSDISMDNTSIWTGCVVPYGPGDDWLMAFTSRDSKQTIVRTWEQQPFTQHISFATSHNREGWKRIPNVHVNADARFYNTQSLEDDITIHAWRDPCIFSYDGDKYGYMLVTAQAKGLRQGQRDIRAGQHAVIALLRTTTPFQLTQWEATGISFIVDVTEAEVPRLYIDTQTGQNIIAYSCKNEAAYLKTGDIGYGFYGFAIEMDVLTSIIANKSPDMPYLIHIDITQRIPLLGYGEDNLYACQVIPEIGGKIMGFDTTTGTLRLSQVKTLPHLATAHTDFSRFSV